MLLASKLLKGGNDSAGDSTAQYVLFDLARQEAVAAGSTDAALAAIEALAAHFEVDRSKLLLDSLTTLSRQKLYARRCRRRSRRGAYRDQHGGGRR